MRWFSIVLLGAITLPAAADVVVLKDGSKLEGDIKKGASGYVVSQKDGKYQVVPFDQVVSLEAAQTGATTPDGARQKLESLRRSVEYLDDLHKIIDRYETFIANNATTTAAADATKDLATWRERLDQGLVKAGGKWVTVEERNRMREEAIRIANDARRLIKQGRLAEADSTIQQALAQDPQNVSALYLKALLQYRQDQLQAARKSFEQVNGLVPNHAPTLNNLAVVLYRTNQLPQALATYDQAMISDPKEPAVLNNVAEALNALPDELRGSAIAQKVARRFTEQDIDLQREMEKQGMHRWGSQWVTTDQLKDLKAAERQVQDKLDRLSAEFDSVKVRIDNIDREIGENERAMRRLEASSYVRDFNGNIYQTVLPATYYQLQDDSAKLQRDRADQFVQLERLRQQAKVVNQDLPVPKYTGIQRLIDVEGTPVQPPDQPTTKPSSAPPTTAPGQRTA